MQYIYSPSARRRASNRRGETRMLGSSRGWGVVAVDDSSGRSPSLISSLIASIASLNVCWRLESSLMSSPGIFTEKEEAMVDSSAVHVRVGFYTACGPSPSAITSRRRTAAYFTHIRTSAGARGREEPGTSGECNARACGERLAWVGRSGHTSIEIGYCPMTFGYYRTVGGSTSGPIRTGAQRKFEGARVVIQSLTAPTVLAGASVVWCLSA